MTGPEGRRIRAARALARALIERWFVVLPLLTAALFALLSLLSLLELGRERGPEPAALTPEEISDRALARTRAESQRLGEIRRGERAGLTARGLLSRLEKAEKEDTLPEVPALLGDYELLRERSPRCPREVFQGTLELLAQAFAADPAPSERFLAALEALLVQSSLGLLESPLGEGETERLWKVLEALAARRPRIARALLGVLERWGSAREEARLRAFLERAGGTPLGGEVERILTSLGERGGGHGG